MFECIIKFIPELCEKDPENEGFFLTYVLGELRTIPIDSPTYRIFVKDTSKGFNYLCEWPKIESISFSRILEEKREERKFVNPEMTYYNWRDMMRTISSTETITR